GLVDALGLGLLGALDEGLALGEHLLAVERAGLEDEVAGEEDLEVLLDLILRLGVELVVEHVRGGGGVQVEYRIALTMALGVLGLGGDHVAGLLVLLEVEDLGEGDLAVEDLLALAGHGVAVGVAEVLVE